MKKTRLNFGKTLGALLAALVVAGSGTSAKAAGMLVADGGLGGTLEIKEHEAQVTINNGVAVTKVTQVFHNTEKRQVEALYTFPVPKGASVANFSMWINGKEMVGEVLEKKKAREIYDSYKQVRRDPGLLEQVDFRTFEMRIFPIGPEADQKVQITYYQELDVDHDWATYVYPLATVTRKGVDSRTTGKFAITLDVKSAVPIAEMESPSHKKAFAIAKHSENYWQANMETSGGSLASDVVLAYRIARANTGMDLITSKDGDDGFFCLTISTGQEIANKQESMDYVFLVDASGSMGSDGKLLLSKDAVAAFLNELGEGDRFEVMSFNVSPDLAFKELRPATAENKKLATDYLSKQDARGGTVLKPAIATAYKYASADRPLNVVILSDGLTEQQERQILLQQIQARPGNTRVFCVGVGNEVNRPLLEQLAEDSGGLSTFISSSDNFARQARAFRQKLTRPFATSLQLKFNGVEVTDLEPATLPNLYFGAPVRVYGRYRGGGTADVTLRGSINGVELKQTVPLEFPKVDKNNPEINRMWALRCVNRLLKEADRKGDRSLVTQEIVQLGEDFSIATEYTSFLVLENDAEYQRWKIARKNQDTFARDSQALAKRREQLEFIRNKALADIGPQAASQVASPLKTVAAANRPVVNTSTAPAPQQPAPQSSPSRQSHDFHLPSLGGGGSGPVGPLGVLATWWFMRRKQKKS
jgi:Ca-activated chloride channel family protein